MSRADRKISDQLLARATETYVLYGPENARRLIAQIHGRDVAKRLVNDIRREAIEHARRARWHPKFWFFDGIYWICAFWNWVQGKFRR